MMKCLMLLLLTLSLLVFCETDASVIIKDVEELEGERVCVEQEENCGYHGKCCRNWECVCGTDSGCRCLSLLWSTHM
uniref:Secretory peptide n=1 Tax=Heteropoda venatoria TaxID=152925 RepID=A0A088BPC9_HETVE|nr:secretory peptide [Heteropoda venatoria]